MKGRSLLVAMGALALVFSLSVAALATVSSDGGFEGADGNLAPESPIDFDWNSFAPTTWTGTAPNRTATDSASGWTLTGLEDRQVSTSDSAFAGGTKQDADCPSVISAKAPNKDDLKRVYVASSTVSGDVFLTLAWVRIPQNTTSPSAHIAFEFNQGDTACGAGSDSLVERSTANGGDMLVVYDFNGGSTDTPVINLSRWVDSGTCEVGSHTPPCWSEAVDLTAGGFAEGKVNTSTVGPVSDAIHPAAPPAQTLGLNEFGEAIINLSDSGVFGSNECVAFGRTYAASRTSGEASTAQMKDLVGPGEINITNCGGIIIRKVTVPSPDTTDTSFDYTTTGALDPATFSLKDGEARDYGSSLQAGSYSVTESDPGPDFTFTSLDCKDSDLSHGSTADVTGATVTIELKALDTVDCTYTNTLNQGAIQVSKTRKFASAAEGDPNSQPQAGVTFEVYDAADTLVASGATGADGVVCFDGLTFGDYTVKELVPSEYVVDGNDKPVTVDNVAGCDDAVYAGETVSFHNTPLTDVAIDVTSQDPGATKSTIDCVDESAASVGSSGAAADPASLDVNDLEPGTYTCTIFIDP